MLLSLDGLTLSIGGKTLFAELDLRLARGDRVGLVGPNGAGKTSLLRLIAGELEPDMGKVHRVRSARLGYLPQELKLSAGQSLLGFVRASIPERTVVEQDPNEFAEHKAHAILAGLGFAPKDAERDLSELSGGWQMRAQLASLLFSRPDVLLLDEPTNHLDVPTVAWFGAFLGRFRGALILISHDREFLNGQVNRIASFEPEGVRAYSGDYDAYVRQRALERDVLASTQKNLARERERAEAFINRFRYQASKARAVQSRVKALERLPEVKLLDEHDRAHFKFAPTTPASRVVLTTQGVSKAYGDRTVLSGVDLSLSRGQRIAVMGVNGAGKTTLLRLLAGDLKPDGGEILFGQNVQLGYYAQHHLEMLAPENTAYDEVARAAKDASPTTIRSLLGALLLAGDAVEKPVGVLSGGERARVALARLLISSCNVVLMDEPTNHLDLDSSERLAEALSSFDGTLVFVSHSLSFVRRLATSIWNVQGGQVETFPGTLDEYLASSLRRFAFEGEPAADDAPQGKANRGDKNDGLSEKEERRVRAAAVSERRRMLAPLEAEVARLEAQISRLEAEQQIRSAELADPALRSEHERRAQLLRQCHEDALALDELTAQWERAATALEETRRSLAAQAASR